MLHCNFKNQDINIINVYLFDNNNNLISFKILNPYTLKEI